VRDVDFQWAPATPSIGEVVTFTGRAAGTTPITLNWDFGDGGNATGQTVTHAYGQAQDYTVVMTATNCEVMTATVTHNIAGVKWRKHLPLVLRSR
jgi:PKD repeat protein